MGIPLDSRIKGAIALEIVSAILLDAGFRILRLGVEELIPSIKTASQNAYRKLDLSRTLTSTPDLLVIAPREEGSVVTEVKFRARWTAETRARLFETAALVEQVRRWGPMYLVVAVAGVAKSRSTLSDHLRVMAVRYDAKTRQIVFFRTIDGKEVVTPAADAAWQDLITLPHAFTGISEDVLSSIDNAALRALRALG